MYIIYKQKQKHHRICKFEQQPPKKIVSDMHWETNAQNWGICKRSRFPVYSCWIRQLTGRHGIDIKILFLGEPKAHAHSSWIELMQLDLPPVHDMFHLQKKVETSNEFNTRHSRVPVRTSEKKYHKHCKTILIKHACTEGARTWQSTCKQFAGTVLVGKGRFFCLLCSSKITQDRGLQPILSHRLAAVRCKLVTYFNFGVRGIHCSRFFAIGSKQCR